MGGQRAEEQPHGALLAGPSRRPLAVQLTAHFLQILVLDRRQKQSKGSPLPTLQSFLQPATSWFFQPEPCHGWLTGPDRRNPQFRGLTVQLRSRTSCSNKVSCRSQRSSRAISRSWGSVISPACSTERKSTYSWI